MQYLVSGIFKWSDEVVSYMRTALKGLSDIKYVNSRNIENIDREYNSLLSQGFKAPVIVSRPAEYAVKWSVQDYTLANELMKRTNIPKLVILNYFLAIYDLAKSGKIDFKYYNPVQVKKSKKEKEILVGKPLLSKITEPLEATANMFPLMLLAGTIFGIYFLIDGRGFYGKEEKANKKG